QQRAIEPDTGQRPEDQKGQRESDGELDRIDQQIEIESCPQRFPKFRIVCQIFEIFEPDIAQLPHQGDATKATPYRDKDRRQSKDQQTSKRRRQKEEGCPAGRNHVLSLTGRLTSRQSACAWTMIGN